MKLQVIWNKTGDNFLATPINCEFTEWYVSEANKLCNEWSNTTDNIFFKRFHHTPSNASVYDLMDELKSNINIINDVLKKFKISPIDTENNFFDQRCLNNVHKQWVNIIRTNSRLTEILHKINPLYAEKFHNINNLIHQIESSFQYRMIVNEYWTIDNEFIDYNWTDIGLYNISIEFNDFGKSSYDKWRYADSDPNDFELSNHETLSGRIDINLEPSKIYNYPDSFLNYCRQHNISPVPQKLPLGNIDNLNILSQAREIMERNIHKTDTNNNNFLFFNILI